MEKLPFQSTTYLHAHAVPFRRLLHNQFEAKVCDQYCCSVLLNKING